MNDEVRDLWRRATRTLATAGKLARDDPDSSASRAYYAAFHAVCALFAKEGKSYTKHSAVEAAVHRDLVNIHRCTEEFGVAFSALSRLRSVADYGSPSHVTADEAALAVTKARMILKTIQPMIGQEAPDDP